MKGENDARLDFRVLMGMKEISFVLGRSLQSLSAEEQLDCNGWIW